MRLTRPAKRWRNAALTSRPCGCRGCEPPKDIARLVCCGVRRARALPQRRAWPGFGSATAPADGGGGAAAARDAAGDPAKPLAHLGSRQRRPGCPRLPRAPQTLRNNQHERAPRWPPPAPPPRKTKDQPPPVPKRGGKRMSFATERVRVAVRIRPLVAHEANQVPSVRCIDRGALEITTPSAGGVSTIKKFDFDLCLGPSSTEDAVFEALGAKALLERSLRGIKATVFAYGATGSGKTHTILGHEREDFEYYQHHQARIW